MAGVCRVQTHSSVENKPHCCAHVSVLLIYLQDGGWHELDGCAAAEADGYYSTQPKRTRMSNRIY